MYRSELDPRLPLIQDADLQDKLVLVRVDHNVVKKGEIHDPYRIDATIGTLYNIVERGGRLILMSHGQIVVKDDTSIQPIVEYLERKLHTKFSVPQFPAESDVGIKQIDTSINWHIRDLRAHRIGGIYLPNTRWFEGDSSRAE